MVRGASTTRFGRRGFDPDSPGGGGPGLHQRTGPRRRFEVTDPMRASARIELVLDSVDTVGSVHLNGVHVGDLRSQFVPAPSTRIGGSGLVW